MLSYAETFPRIPVLLGDAVSKEEALASVGTCCEGVCLWLGMMDELLTGNCNSDQMQTDLAPESFSFIKIPIDLFGASSSLQTALHFNTFWELII